jgi:hypothetical protein
MTPPTATAPLHSSSDTPRHFRILKAYGFFSTAVMRREGSWFCCCCWCGLDDEEEEECSFALLYALSTHDTNGPLPAPRTTTWRRTLVLVVVEDDLNSNEEGVRRYRYTALS